MDVDFGFTIQNTKPQFLWPIELYQFAGGKQSMGIKVAVPTDDGETISRHFGQARYFKVITLENNQVTSSELREKASHQHGDHSHAEGVHPGQQMVEAISDCQALIAGGMGTPAFNRATSAGLAVFLTGNSSIQPK